MKKTRIEDVILKMGKYERVHSDGLLYCAIDHAVVALHAVSGIPGYDAERKAKSEATALLEAYYEGTVGDSVHASYKRYSGYVVLILRPMVDFQGVSGGISIIEIYVPIELPVKIMRKKLAENLSIVA